MEFDYNQSQKGVLEYAHGLVDNGYTPGIFMIDEGWHTRYGLWEFDFAKFPDPKGMIDELHSLGFTVMLWVTPLYTCDGRDFVLAADPDRAGLVGSAGDKKYFLRTDDGGVAIVKWWEGFSAILNFCREEDREFLALKLQRLMDDYGVDGFKLDGGIIAMYNPGNIQNGTQTHTPPDELNIDWNEFGERFEYHEYKDTYKGGGKGEINTPKTSANNALPFGMGKRRLCRLIIRDRAVICLLRFLRKGRIFSFYPLTLHFRFAII